MKTSLRVAVVGLGYWGSRILSQIQACRPIELVAIYDPIPERMIDAKMQFPWVTTCPSLQELLRSRIDAVILATPPSTHYELAHQCLEHGIHVFIEKPMTTSASLADRLAQTAKQRSLTLMVDHTTTFSKPVIAAKELFDNGELGTMCQVNAVRFGLGRFSHDTDVVWDLAVHDLATIDFVTGARPTSVSAKGKSLTESGIVAQADIHVAYDNGLVANVGVSWLSSLRTRKTIFVGSRRTLVLDELAPSSSLTISDSDGSATQHQPIVEKDAAEIHIGAEGSDNPLRSALKHFSDCIITGSRPKSDGVLGTRIVRILEAATNSIHNQGVRQVYAK